MKEKITMNIFSRSSIENAKQQLMKIADKVDGGNREAVKRLTQLGYEYMMTIVKMESGNLADSITWEYDEANNVGKIKVGAKYAIFVEYGTGIRGKSSPHPEPIAGWVYDVNEHGEAGWWYPTTASDPNPTKKRTQDGTWIAHTKGQPASAFVYKTREYMRNHAKETMRVNIYA